MEHPTLKAQIQSCYEARSREVFREIHEAIECLEDQPENIQAAAVKILAQSDALDLTLTLRIPYAVLRACHPLRDSAIALDDATLLDWDLELANRLLGKIKGHINTHEGELRLGLPALSDEGVKEGSEHCPLYFSLNEDFLSCELEITVKQEHLELSIIDERSDYEDAGELELF